VVPLISPNVLKNKLLKRIKEHKLRETESLDSKKKSDLENTSAIPVEIGSYSDEFTDSLNYLQTLSKQQKINNDKINYLKRKEELERKTVKNYHSLHEHSQINIDLPEELLTINTEQYTNINNKNNNDIPYGILKGGIKPTYRDWNKTQRCNIVTDPNSALTIQNNDLNKERNERENRLNNLREKLKLKQKEELIRQKEELIDKNEDIMTSQNLIHNPNSNANAISNPSLPNPIPLPNNIPLTNNIPLPNPSTNPLTNPSTNPLPNPNIIGTKKIIKKTIKRKYTLGRSKINKTIAVLIKDRGTRKQIITAQKDLKKKNIDDVKIYLRNHNLIKIGSNAPNNIIRKIFESSMLAGEITNSNSDILLHNFSKENKEL
jgi:hypothetical protein